MAIDLVPWWKDAVIYQIYPASFNDSNNDGVGDFNGITQKLDYIKSIGVDAVWICPMFDSPQVDMGYDIRDYEKVYAPYGTMQDMENLIEEAHNRGLKVLLDLVINHTSDQHAWFQESRSSKDNPKRDWYIWKDAKFDADGNRVPPNNWRSNFGGSVWEWDEHTQQYYLHLFCVEQPDLNWENDECRNAIYQSAMVFWLEKGVDGFRVDTVNMYSKPLEYPDALIVNPDSLWQDAGLVYCNGPRMNEYLEEMNAILAKYNAMSVGECPCTPDPNRVIEYVSAKRKRLNMVFQFDTVDVGMGTPKFNTTPFNYVLADLKNAISRSQALLDGTDAHTTTFLENHDQARCVSRFGDDSPQWRQRSAKMLALMTAALSGTLYVYEGQELGMINMPKSWGIEEYKDVDSTNYYKEVAARTNNDPEALARVLAAVQHLARDHARVPMQWSAAENAGFCAPGVTPWMRANPSAQEGINVEDETRDKKSVLAFWRRLLNTRREHRDTMVHGRYTLVDAANDKVFSFVKTAADGKTKALAICNFHGADSPLPVVEGFSATTSKLVLHNVDEEQGDRPDGSLAPWECRFYTY